MEKAAKISVSGNLSLIWEVSAFIKGSWCETDVSIQV